MNSGSDFPERATTRGRRAADRASDRELSPAIRESAAATRGIYDARRLRSQRDVIRDVMLAAADCDTWLTLAELRALTHYGETSISAQLRHLRKTINGGYEVIKRRREDASPAQSGESMWEYRIEKCGQAGQGAEAEKTLQVCEA
jgi:hypothetical protein